MSDDYGGGWMNAVAARYQVKTTIIAPAPGANRQILAADPRRWYLRISIPQAGGTVAAVAPEPLPLAGGSIVNTPMPIEVKFRDAPPMCTGAWWVNNPGAVQFVIWEVIYVGE